jgi:hypothetical protein
MEKAVAKEQMKEHSLALIHCVIPGECHFLSL